MGPLKVTVAREITKESVTEAETLVVNGVSVSKPSEHPMQEGFLFPADAHPARRETIMVRPNIPTPQAINHQ